MEFSFLESPVRAAVVAVPSRFSFAPVNILACIKVCIAHVLCMVLMWNCNKLAAFYQVVDMVTKECGQCYTTLIVHHPICHHPILHLRQLQLNLMFLGPNSAKYKVSKIKFKKNCF